MQGVKFGDGDVIMLDLDMDLGELRFERGGAEQLPTISGLTGSFHVCVAMFFNGASCELRELSLSGGHYKSPRVPCTSTPGLPTAAPAVSGVPRTSSVPRLALKDVGELPVTRELKAVDTAVDHISLNGGLVGSGHPFLSDSATSAIVAGNSRPSPRLAGASVSSAVGPHRLLTPRTLALSEGTGMTVERPSPQGTPRAISSPRGSLAPLCPAGIYPSPRYVSPRTPRSIQQPSPRKPEAVPATLTISQHKELDSAIRRVETLEEHLSVTLAENRRLQEALSKALGRGGSSEADVNGEVVDEKSGPLLPAFSYGSDDCNHRSAESSARKNDGTAAPAASFGAETIPCIHGDISSVKNSQSAEFAIVEGAKIKVDTGTQPSPRDVSSDTSRGILLKHWELDWKALEKVCLHACVRASIWCICSSSSSVDFVSILGMYRYILRIAQRSRLINTDLCIIPRKNVNLLECVAYIMQY